MSARELDPDMAAFMDAMRAAFGAAEINTQVKKGMAGIPGHFHYRGPAGVFGAPPMPTPPGKEIHAGQMQIDTYHLPQKGRQ